MAVRFVSLLRDASGIGGKSAASVTIFGGGGNTTSGFTIALPANARVAASFGLITNFLLIVTKLVVGTVGNGGNGGPDAPRHKTAAKIRLE